VRTIVGSDAHAALSRNGKAGPPSARQIKKERRCARREAARAPKSAMMNTGKHRFAAGAGRR